MSAVQNAKTEKVHSIFSAIAPKYDLVNDIISFGRLHAWRKACVEISGATSGSKILDVATGTGDLAIAFKKAVGGKGSVIGVDFCADMLSFAPAKARGERLEIDFRQGDATALDFTDASFDVVSIAYGLRNVGDTAKAIREMSRVVKPGGKLMVLETGRSSWPVFNQIFNFYFAKLMPIFGGAITGEPGAYKYLDASSKDFPYGQKLAELLRREGGFKDVIAHPMFGGVSYVYECLK